MIPRKAIESLVRENNELKAENASLKRRASLAVSAIPAILRAYQLSPEHLPIRVIHAGAAWVFIPFPFPPRKL